MLTDSLGKMLVVLKGFSTRVVKTGEQDDGVMDKTKDSMLFFEPVFEPKVLLEQAQQSFSGAVLVLDDGNGAVMLQRPLVAQGLQAEQLIRVKAGKTFERVEDSVYRLDVKNVQDFEKLLQVLKEDGKKIDTVVYAVDKKQTDQVSQGTVDKAMDVKRCLGVLLCMTQAWVRQRAKDKVKIVCLSTDRGVPDSCVAGALWGFLQTLVQEHSCFECKVIKVDTVVQDERAVDDMSSWIAHELLLFNAKVEYLRYQAGRRLVMKYKEVAKVVLD